MSQLISDQNEPTDSQIEIESIVPNRKQPRSNFDESALQDLADSISKVGLLQPLVVRPLGDSQYELIAGERRWRASKMAGLSRVPVMLRSASDHSSLELAIIENVQRENLGALELARAYRRLMDEFDMTQESVAAQVGKSRSAIANTVRLLRLPSRILESLEQGSVTEGQVRPLLTCESEAQQLALFDKIIADQLNTRDIENLVQPNPKAAKPRTKQTVVDSQDPNWRALSGRASEVLGAPVKLEGTEKGGSVVIRFFSEDDLLRIMDQLGIQL